MKTIAIILSTTTVILGQNTTAGDLERKFDHVKGMISFLLTGTIHDDPSRRNFRDKIQDYGCFCYPGDSNQVRFSPSPPVDAIDAFCKKLHRRWHCLESDAETNLGGVSSNCHRDHKEHGDGSYKFHGKTEIDGSHSIICGTESTGGYENVLDTKPQLMCKYRACQIERAFAEELVALDFDSVWNADNIGMVGRGECIKNQVPAPGAGGDEDCCGEYPNRFPYNNNNVANGLKECCPDGEIKIIGTC